MTCTRCFRLGIAGLALSCATAAGALDLYVTTAGDDANPGTAAQPKATLAGARDAIRASGRAGKEPITVHVAPGVYTITESIVFGANDSGAADNPITYRAHDDAPVRLQGGRVIPADAWKPVTGDALKRLPVEARPHVRVADLAPLGMPRFEPLPDSFRGAQPYPELFYDDQPMTLARFPNDGWLTIETVIDRGGRYSDAVGPDGNPTNGAFTYHASDRPARWDTARGVWLHGYWCHDWSDEVIRIDTLDTTSRTITLAAPHHYGIGPSTTWNKVPRRYYALNLLEELDAPGEWYLDTDNQRLYFRPPAPLEPSTVVLSTLADPLLNLQEAAHLTFRGFTLEACQQDAVRIHGGHDNLIAACTIRNVGRTGVTVTGTRNGVQGCNITRSGASGIELDGGDRPKLVAAENFADNNHIHHFARRARTYQPGVRLRGVGHRVSHNAIHDCPHSGILYNGNEHVIEFNDIFNTCLETGDAGALYTGRDWGSQGNVVRHNFIHHNGGHEGWSMGVYLDDCDSGDTLVGNVFYRVKRAAFIGGGRNNTVENNLFIDCDPALWIDDRGTRRIRWDAPRGDSWNLPAKLEAMDYRNPPWSERYPHLVDILDDQPALPLHNRVAHNLVVGGTWIKDQGDSRSYLELTGNVVTDSDPGFVDPDKLDFRLRADASIWQEAPGFEQPRLKEMGLYADELRASWPVELPPLPGGLATPVGDTAP